MVFPCQLYAFDFNVQVYLGQPVIILLSQVLPFHVIPQFVAHFSCRVSSPLSFSVFCTPAYDCGYWVVYCVEHVIRIT